MWFRVGERELDDLDRYRREGMDDLVIRADELVGRYDDQTLTRLHDAARMVGIHPPD